MAEKKKSRRSYLNDFKEDAGGKLVYTGAVYCYAGERSLREHVLWQCSMAALAVLACVAVGCMTAPGMQNSPYVLLPYAAETLLACVVLWKSIRMALQGERIRSYIFDETVKRLPGYLVCLLFFAAAGAVGEGVFLILSGTGGKYLEIVLLYICKAAVIVLSWLEKRRIESVSWQKDPRD